MKYRPALLLAAALTAPAFAGPPTWTPIPVGPPTVNIYPQQQPDYAKNVGDGFSDLARAIERYGASRKPAPAVTGQTVYLRDPNDPRAEIKCTKYGESIFCD